MYHKQQYSFPHSTSDTSYSTETKIPQSTLQAPAALSIWKRLSESTEGFSGAGTSSRRAGKSLGKTYVDLYSGFFSPEDRVTPEMEQGKKVFKSYCRPMLSLFSLYKAPRAQKSKLVTPRSRSYSALLSTASGGRQ